MHVLTTSISDVLVLTPNVYTDDRGAFSEVFNVKAFEERTGVVRAWVQDNESVSRQGVLRGLHYQLPSAQGKLVRCSSGSVFDVAVDIRRSSATFKQWVGVELSAENHAQIWIPEGFAHGFLTLSEKATVNYKTTHLYDGGADRAIRWDDPDIAVDWPEVQVALTVSDKDQNAPLLKDAVLFE